jgi:hypothetical protein
MRRLLPLLAALLSLAARAADSPSPGKNLPGPFHPFNVTGPYADHFHCPVSDHNLDPGVLVFVRDLNLTPPLRKLLTGLDSAIEKNPAVRLAATVTFLSDDLPNVVEEDDKRDELKARVQELAKGLGLKHVVLTLDSKPDVEKYLRDVNLAVAVVLYKKFHVVSSHDLPRDKITDAAVQQILDAVASQLGAKKK